MIFTSRPYDLVFSGGGLRSLYGLGWASRLQERGVFFENIYASSSGASFSIPLIQKNYFEFIDYCVERSKSYQHFNRSFLSEGSFFSFQKNYLNVLSWTIQLEKIKESPSNLYFSAYKLESTSLAARFWHFYRLLNLSLKDISQYSQNNNQSVSLKTLDYISKAGIVEEIFTLKDFSDDWDLKQALLATCSIPPLIKSTYTDRTYIDGGLVWPMPLHLPLKYFAAEKRNEILAICNDKEVLTYTQNTIPAYFSNQRPVVWHHAQSVPIKMWDYGNGAAIENAFLLGRTDADKILIKGE